MRREPHGISLRNGDDSIFTTQQPPETQAVFVSPQDIETRLSDYFDTYLAEKNEIADVESLAVFLHTTRETLLQLLHAEPYGEALSRAFCRIANVKKQLAFAGKIPATVYMFDMRNNHGYADKPEAAREPTQIIFEGSTLEWAQ